MYNYTMQYVKRSKNSVCRNKFHLNGKSYLLSNIILILGVDSFILKFLDMLFIVKLVYKGNRHEPSLSLIFHLYYCTTVSLSAITVYNMEYFSVLFPFSA